MYSNIFLMDIMETVVDGIIILDSDGFLQDINTKFASMSGYTKKELIGINIFDISTYKTPDLSYKYAEPLISKLINEGSMNNYKTSYVRKNGSAFIAEINIKTLRDDNGKITNYIVAILDITDRTNWESELKANEKSCAILLIQIQIFSLSKIKMENILKSATV